MTAAEARHRVESPEFCALVNVASSLKVFIRILTTDAAMTTLSAGNRIPSEHSEILRRLITLAESEPEDGFEHPADAALGDYLWLLRVCDQDTCLCSSRDREDLSSLLCA